MSSWMIRAVVLAAALLVVNAPVAIAAPGTGAGGGSGGSADGVLTAGVTMRIGGADSGGGSHCSWERVPADIIVTRFGSMSFPYTDDDGVTFNLWHKTCTDGTGDWYVVPETRPEDLLPTLLEELRSRALPEPLLRVYPLDEEHGWVFVQVPVDVRVSAESWRDVSVTASIGAVWATVTAVPVRLVFDAGDPNGPGPVSCGGDGPVAGYDPAAPGVCSYTYRNASSTSPYDGYHFVTTTSIEWSISWTSSTGAGGSLGSYSTSSSELLAVAEVKGLVTCTGSRAEQGGC